MKHSIAVLLTALLLSTSSFSNPVATASGPNGEWIQLTNEPCRLPEVVKRMGSVYGPKALQAQAIIDGKKFEACYVTDGGTVGIMYEDGDVGMIPAAAFKPSKIT